MAKKHITHTTVETPQAINSNFSYDESLKELQQIVDDLQNNITQIDDISEKAKRAQELLKACRAQLRQIKNLTKEFE